MNGAKYTPAPWRIEYPDDGDASVGMPPTPGFVYHDTPDGHCIPICTLDDPTYTPTTGGSDEPVYPVNVGYVSGNARLIAESPAMYETLRAIADFAPDMESGIDPHTQIAVLAKTRAREALAKLDGSETHAEGDR